MNSDSNKLSVRLYGFVSIAISAVTTICGVFAFLFSGSQNGRYLKTSPLSILFCILILTGIAWAIVSYFLFASSQKILYPQKTKDYLGFFPTAASLTCAAVSFLDFSKIVNSPNFQDSDAQLKYAVFAVLLASAALLSALSCFSGIIKLPQTAVLLLGYIRVLFAAAAIARIYLDQQVEMNSPYKLLIQFSLAASMLYTLTELAPVAGHPHNARRFLFSSTICVTLTPIGLIAAILGSISSPLLGTNYLIYAIFAAAFVPQTIAGLLSAQLKIHRDQQEDRTLIATDQQSDPDTCNQTANSDENTED